MRVDTPNFRNFFKASCRQEGFLSFFSQVIARQHPASCEGGAILASQALSQLATTPMRRGSEKLQGCQTKARQGRSGEKTGNCVSE